MLGYAGKLQCRRAGAIMRTTPKKQSRKMVIRGRVRDIQPNKARPTLELYFDAKYRSALPHGKRVVITLDLSGERWQGTINSSGNHPPYFHTHLSTDTGITYTCTQVFLNVELAEGAILDFVSETDTVLRLERIVDHGKWRFGNEPGKRKARGQSTAIRRQQTYAKKRTQSITVGKSRIQRGDVERLESAMNRDFPDAQPSTDPAWSRAPALRVIDCVLSLNRRYDAFVVPRLDRFERDNPQVTSVRDLQIFISKFKSPADFMRKTLDYNHPDRARILKAVLDFIIGITKHAPVKSEIPILEQWAKSASPKDYVSLSISGFALAGFQYLRMLFGANTTKPDLHIRGYVKEAVGHSVTNLEAIKLLEAVAERQGIFLRDADTNIWEKRARWNTKGDVCYNEMK